MAKNRTENSAFLFIVWFLLSFVFQYEMDIPTLLKIYLICFIIQIENQITRRRSSILRKYVQIFNSNFIVKISLQKSMTYQMAKAMAKLSTQTTLSEQEYSKVFWNFVFTILMTKINP